MPFDGETYDRCKDGARLGKQLAAVRRALVAHQGEWWTLSELAAQVDAPEASVSARLRDLRKEKFGGFEVERRRVEGQQGLWEYRLAPKKGVR